jgi:hypothetical protein
MDIINYKLFEARKILSSSGLTKAQQDTARQHVRLPCWICLLKNEGLRTLKRPLGLSGHWFTGPARQGGGETAASEPAGPGGGGL